MRLELTISDQLYQEAQRAAQVVGVTVEKFFTEALEFRLNEEAERITLTSEQIAIIRRGQADIKAGKGIPLEQVKANLAAHRAAWQPANPS